MSAVLSTSPTIFNSTEQKALELLGAGVEQVAVANALGITEGRLSQIISAPEFSAALTDARYKNLAKHNETDNLYDKIERKLADKLERSADLMFKPTEIARTLSLVNGLKRRGASNPDSIVRQKNVIKLNIPVAIVNRFQLNAAGQVITATSSDGQSQDLVTMQSGNLKGLLNEHAKLVGSDTPTEHSYRTDRPAKLANYEQSGVLYRKPQGRAKEDLMGELGFTVELTTDPLPSDSDSRSSENSSS